MLKAFQLVVSHALCMGLRLLAIVNCMSIACCDVLSVRMDPVLRVLIGTPPELMKRQTSNSEALRSMPKTHPTRITRTICVETPHLS